MHSNNNERLNAKKNQDRENKAPQPSGPLLPELNLVFVA